MWNKQLNIAVSTCNTKLGNILTSNRVNLENLERGIELSSQSFFTWINLFSYALKENYVAIPLLN